MSSPFFPSPSLNLGTDLSPSSLQASELLELSPPFVNAFFLFSSRDATLTFLHSFPALQIFGLIIGGALLLGGWSWICELNAEVPPSRKPLAEPSLVRPDVAVYFSTIIATPLAIACVFLIPDPKTIRHVEPPVALVDGVEVPAARGPRMDYLVRPLPPFLISLLSWLLTSLPISVPRQQGTFLQTAAIVLLIFGLTQANGTSLPAILPRSSCDAPS